MANAGPPALPVHPAVPAPQAPQAPPALLALQAPQQPTKPVQHMPQLNWSHFKPKFSGKPGKRCRGTST